MEEKSNKIGEKYLQRPLYLHFVKYTFVAQEKISVILPEK